VKYVYVVRSFLSCRTNWSKSIKRLWPPTTFFSRFFFFFLFVVAYIDDIHSFSLTSTSSAYAHIYRHQIVVSKKKKKVNLFLLLIWDVYVCVLRFSFLSYSYINGNRTIVISSSIAYVLQLIHQSTTIAANIQVRREG